MTREKIQTDLEAKLRNLEDWRTYTTNAEEKAAFWREQSDAVTNDEPKRSRFLDCAVEADKEAAIGRAHLAEIEPQLTTLQSVISELPEQSNGD